LTTVLTISVPEGVDYASANTLVRAFVGANETIDMAHAEELPDRQLKLQPALGRCRSLNWQRHRENTCRP